MIPHLRSSFNAQFTPEKYQKMIDWIEHQYGHRPPFRIAETPVFIPDELRRKLLQACNEITDVLVRPDFKELSKGALLAGQEVPNETEHTSFLQMDFGICRTPDGELVPQLIEVQGFPSLYFFQDLLANAYRKFYDIPERNVPFVRWNLK
jgi:hypothetical protein